MAFEQYRQRIHTALVAAGIEGVWFSGGLSWKANVDEFEILLVVAPEERYARAAIVVPGSIAAVPRSFPPGVSIAVGSPGTLEVSAESYDATPETIRDMVNRVVTAARAVGGPSTATKWVRDSGAN
jgi:hypothetical protein